MSTVYEFVAKGGPTMIPIVGLSIATLYCGLERAWYWTQLLRQENQIVREILEVASYDLERAAIIAENHQHLPIGRFLFAPLRLQQPSSETFRLALEAAGDREFIQMQKGDKLLETVVAIAPLLGLLGTVTGLIVTFQNLNVGGSSSSIDTTKAAAGIAEALITTAGGMIVAIIALAFLRLFVSFQSTQIEYFSAVGSELELIYRQSSEAVIIPPIALLPESSLSP